MLDIIGIIDCNTTAATLKGNIEFIINAISTINETIIIIFSVLLDFCFLNTKIIHNNAIIADKMIPINNTKKPP